MTAYPRDTSAEVKRALHTSLAIPLKDDSTFGLDFGATMKPSPSFLRSYDDRLTSNQETDIRKRESEGEGEGEGESRSRAGSAVDDTITAGHWQPGSISHRSQAAERSYIQTFEESKPDKLSPTLPKFDVIKTMRTYSLPLFAASLGLGVLMAKLVSTRRAKGKYS